MKKYKVLLADPPWLYDDHRTHASAGMARSAYECLSVDDLCALPVRMLADRDAMLCLWATFPKLPEALRVIDAWGFRYITTLFVWVKARPKWTGGCLEPSDVYSGLGHYTNANAEIVLLGRKGNPWRCARNVKQIVIAPRGRHSAKPEEVRTRIEALFGAVPRIEIFAREAPDGWDVLGNQVDGEDIRESLPALVGAGS